MFNLRKPVTLSKRSDGWARHLGGKFLATSNAVRSLASSAIFCAGMTSPAMRILFRHKTPAGQLAAGRVQLEDIDADAMTHPISLSSSVARAHLAFASETVFKKLLAPGMQHPSQPQHAGHGRLTIHQPCRDKASSAAGSKLRITVGSPDGERARRGITDSLQPSSYL
jgi:hypothetical protein